MAVSPSIEAKKLGRVVGVVTVAKTPTEYVTEHAGVITSVLAAITALVALVRGIIKLYNRRREQIVEVLEMPNKLDRMFGELSGQITTLKAFSDITREALKVATWECDTKGYCVEASPALCELFGQTREQMMGRGWLESIPSNKERDEAWNSWASSVSNHIPYRDEYQVRNLRTGAVKHCSATSKAVMNENGEVVRYIGYVVESPDRSNP